VFGHRQLPQGNMQLNVDERDMIEVPKQAIFTARRYAKRGICRRHVSVCPSVCVCVCVSVTLRYCIKTAKHRITQITPHDSPGL